MASKLEETLWLHIKCMHTEQGLPLPEREYTFSKHIDNVPKNWRSDFVWPEFKLVFECEGGIWSQGRHSRGQGFNNDVDKYNWLTLNGWRVLRGTTNHVNNGRAIQWICGALNYDY